MESVLQKTPDDFTFTVSGNPFSKERVLATHRLMQTLHRDRVREARIQDPASSAVEDAEIGRKRFVF